MYITVFIPATRTANLLSRYKQEQLMVSQCKHVDASLKQTDTPKLVMITEKSIQHINWQVCIILTYAIM